MLTLWERMVEMFGHAWRSQYGEVEEDVEDEKGNFIGTRSGRAFLTWANGLLDLSENQIKAGVTACKNWTDRFPPSLGQFRELCLGAPRTGRPESKNRRLPPRQSDPEIVRQVRAFELKRQARIPLSVKTREPHEDDVETFRESWDNLGLSKRYGPCAYD